MSYSDDLLLAIKSGYVIEVHETYIGCRQNSECYTCPFSHGCVNLATGSGEWSQFLKQFIANNPELYI